MFVLSKTACRVSPAFETISMLTLYILIFFSYFQLIQLVMSHVNKAKTSVNQPSR